MGFYGNIQNSNKTAFTFDLIYHSRLTMVNHANDDGVFLGRYVLVDYDETAVSAYYNSTDNWFYNDKNLMLPHKILNPKFNIIYEVANEDYPIDQPRFFYYRPKGFYEENSPAQFEPISIKITDGTGDSIDATSISPYAVSHTLDVREFGRGYDSTVWQKVFDNGKYKYVLVAELNAKVPNFRLIADHPTETPVSPYFDRDSTTMDYYLHQSPAFGNRIKAVPDEEDRSDEEMVRNEITYVYTDEKNPTWSEEPVKRNADIYYNKAGFDKDSRTYIASEDPRSKNTINYDRVESGRHYGYQDGPIYKAGETYPDTYEWYFRLPVLGNTISSLWDAMYGYSGDANETGGITTNKRYLEFAQEENDRNTRRVSYNKNTLIGLMNNVRDLMGHQFLPLSVLNNSTTLETGEETVSVTHNYATSGIDATVTYNKVNVLYYTLDANNSVDKYYYFAYDPSFAEVDETQMKDDGTQYYYYDGATDEYKLANIALYNATDANGAIIKILDEDGQQITGYPYDNYFTKVDHWTLTELPVTEDSLHGLVLTLHKIIGTGDIDTRDEDTLYGAINIIKDIVANIDKKLDPGRFVVTNTQTGVMETSDTYFPSADWDKDEVLDGEGHWVSRFAQVTILPQSTNANQDAPEVNDISEDGKEDDDSIILESDNDKEAQGNEAIRRNKHSANNLTLGTRNKWIELHPNAEKDSIEFQHANSSIVDRLYAEQADGGSSKNVNSIREDNEPNLNNNNITITDDDIYKNFTVNEEVEITVTPTSDNSLKYSSENADTNDNRLTIPYLTADNAGHIVELGTKNFNIPHGFKKVKTTTIADNDEEKSEASSLDQEGTAIAETITDTLNLAPQNRWIDIATIHNEDEGIEEDQITFGHRLVPELNKDVTLNGERRTKANEIPTVYRYGLPQDKSVTDFDAAYNGGNGIAYEAENTFNVPYIEVDKAGHVVAAETHIVTLPENFSTITVEPQNESTSDEANTITDEKATLTADTLTDELVLKTVNRWIGIGLTDNQDNDILTFGHRLSDIRNVEPLNLNGSRRANSKYTNVYRYGLPQNKTVADLDKKNNGGSGIAYEDENTFNVPYMEIDEAGHIVHAETHTVTLPKNFTTITIAEASNSPGIKAIAETTEEAGDIADSLAGSGTLQADTLTDDIKISASNKWIRLKGADATSDEITIGHEIHKIFTSTPVEDMDVTKKDQFSTQILTWDNAGHIVTNETKTWTLPNSIHNLEVTGISTDSNNPAGTNGTIVAGTTFDVVKLNASNQWIRLTADPTNNTITFGHLVQGTAGIYNNGEYTFNKTENDTVQTGVFGGSVILHGYQTDNAGHIIANQTYSLKLPEGSYSESGGDAGSNVLTSLNFTPASGALIGTKVNIGTLKITGYNTDGMTAQAIGADNTLNKALALLQLEIDAETTRAKNAESTLQTNLDTEASTRSSEDGKLQEAIDKEIEDRANAITTLSGNVYTKEEVYTKTEIDNAIYTQAEVDEAIQNALENFARTYGLTVPTT